LQAVEGFKYAAGEVREEFSPFPPQDTRNSAYFRQQALHDVMTLSLRAKRNYLL
jgi:hypothetical protein